MACLAYRGALEQADPMILVSGKAITRFSNSHGDGGWCVCVLFCMCREGCVKMSIERTVCVLKFQVQL